LEQKMFGRYRIVAELGRGAMGAVYRAVDPLIEREVAVKTLLPNLPEEVVAEVRERFLREAKSAGRLNHPNIVTIYDVGEQEGVAYIAMELLEGRSLQQMLRDPQPLSLDQVADIVAQVAEALDYAQRHKIVHRDVKPANVMVDSHGRAKLADFGVAHVPSSTMTQTGTALGSPRYMSPEQVLGLPIDPRSDIFSLGVVLYEALTRRTPFERASDTNVFSLMHRIAGEPHAPVHEIDPKIPAAFDRILDRALAKKPEERYQRAGEMAAELRNYRNLAAAAAAPATAYEKTVAIATAPNLRALEDDKARTQLLTDLEKFARNFEDEERERVRKEQEARLRKEEDLKRWSAEQERKRQEFERQREKAGTAAGGATDPGVGAATRRGAALEMLKKQAAAQPPKVDQAAVRAKAMAGLDQSMRSAFQYLAELGRELNSVSPATGRPYEYFYLGRIGTVTLSEAFVDARPQRIEGKDYTQHIVFRYRITLAQPAKASLLGADIQRAEQYFKARRASCELKPEAKNDFGQVTRASIVVSGALPCEINLRADYDNPGVTIELIDARRAGKIVTRVGAEELNDIVDDLARFVLGADDDFDKVLKRGK
jgi:hypothetical protein